MAAAAAVVVGGDGGDDPEIERVAFLVVGVPL